MQALRLPQLRYDHPGYFTVALALLCTHVALAIDALLPGRHSHKGWAVINSVIDHQTAVLAVVHLMIAVLIGVGLYWRFHFARLGFLLSFIVFNTLGVAFFASAVMDPTTSFYATILSLSLSLSSLAAYREPRKNPAYRA